jgi:hypothetical protein
MKRLAVTGIVLIALLVGGAQAAGELTLTVVSQTNSTITLGWTPQPGYGYLFSVNDVLVSRTNDASRSSVKFSKVTNGVYEVAVIVKGATGVYPTAPPPPPPPKNQCEDSLDNDGDGKIDYPDDPGCTGLTDNDETDPAPPPPTGCATSTPNVPDGPDGNGGCFPGTANTGPNAPQSTMATYTGPCNITVANTVIDSKVVRCDIVVNASGLVIKNSYVFGAVHGDGPTFRIEDSLIDGATSNGYACINCGVDNDNFTILRTEIIHTNRGAYCSSNCVIQDSYVHGTNLEPVASNMAHASGIRQEQGTTLRHNTISCDFKGPFVNSEIGCSADLTGYPDFAPIKNNPIDRNLFVANTAGNAFCAYGGATNGKPFSSDPTNATNIKFTNNVFQKGTGGHPGPCGDFGAVADFNGSRTGNVFTGNKYDDGTTVVPG